MLDTLVQVEIFQGLPPEWLARLAAQARRAVFPAGSRLICQGDVARCLYIICTGSVRVERWHPDSTLPFVLVECGPGDVVGELGLLDSRPHPDSIVAAEDTEVLALDAAVLAQTALQPTDPSRALLHLLSRRVGYPTELAPQLQHSEGAVAS